MTVVLWWLLLNTMYGPCDIKLEYIGSDLLRTWRWGEFWTLEGRGNGGMEEIAWRGAKWLVLLTQYCAGYKIEDEMGWACGAYGWGEGVYRDLVGKPEGRRPMGKPRRRWVGNIRTDLQEVGCGYMDWIWLAQNRDRWRTVVSAVMNLRVSLNAGNFLTSCKPVSFSRKTLHHGVSK